ncbi:MAG: signal recognition particle-docking protein FtsY [Christensenellales bacterium]
MADSFFTRLKEGMRKTREGIAKTLDNVIASFQTIDDDFLEELEEVLIMADVGSTASRALIEQVKTLARERKITDTGKVKELLRETMIDMMREEEAPAVQQGDMRILLIVGVNGVGKTTSIGKLACYYVDLGESVMLAAGDTFRAAAAEQLEVWSKRAKVPLVRHGEGADPSAVIFDAIQSAKAKGAGLLICDTAGRLQTKKNLMEELKKIRRVIGREAPDAVLETYLVLDATTGQNAVSQARIFNETLEIDGIILTKMDGTAKGGIVLAIKQDLGIPVLFIGVGEKIDDLQPFDAGEFVGAIL